jgi:hypothetical protein
MWAEHVVVKSSLRRPGGTADPTRFALDLRLNWSRSIPMSCVDTIAVAIDGEPVAPDTITLRQGGAELPLEGWRTRDDIWWPVLEASTLTGSAPTPLRAGPHALEVELRVRVPGFAPGPDGIWPTRFTRIRTTEELR